MMDRSLIHGVLLNFQKRCFMSRNSSVGIAATYWTVGVRFTTGLVDPSAGFDTVEKRITVSKPALASTKPPAQ
jgi:hypothetical protein